MDISQGIIDLPVDEMFASDDWKVICRRGENYYLSCGQQVYTKPEGGYTTCVKPIGHKTSSCEDYEGTVTRRGFYPQNLDEQTRWDLSEVLKRTGLDSEQTYNALNAMLYAGFKVTRENDG